MNSGPAVQKLVNIWREVYNSVNPLESLKKIDGEFPPKLVEEMEKLHFVLPEPFYGPLEQEMSNDLLVLLMNPGEVDMPEIYVPRLNATTVDRYTTWRRDNFLRECGRLDQVKIEPISNNSCDTACVLHDLNDDGCRWRRTRYREAKFDVKLSFDLLNTMEYIPYHSRRFNDLDKDTQNWLFDVNTTKMAFDAVCEIAEKHVVKHIVSLGGAWLRILKKRGFQPVEDISIVRSSDQYTWGRLIKFQISDSALPIVIHLYQGAIKFPTNQTVVNEMRRMLGEPIIDPTDPNDPDFVIRNNI